MDVYDEEPEARPDQPGGSDDPGSRPPEGAVRDLPENPSAAEAARASDAGGPDPDEAAEVARPAERGGPAPDAAAPPGRPPTPVADPGDAEPAACRRGMAALSQRYQIAAAVALAVVAVAACVHLGMVFLHVAPSNTVTKKHGKAIDAWIYPEFEQNWKLFAPNPLQQNIDVQVRAEVLTSDGSVRTTGWYDLSALDGAAIHGNLLPSHTQQNELRRAWDFYLASHDGENRPSGLRGALSENYVRRLVVLRLGREHAVRRGETLARVQVRSRTTNVPPPEWSGEQVSPTPVYRELPWWSVPEGQQTGAST
ncbi:DUF5819 family protein [Streptomyces chiangmaiensis]|uniref:DUF5819 family protein n=1 Tax=Streptomyces chiangmaiensis TaxID=766497 RepID=A0ABU7F9Y8_9ACTN|nr:DUF5819 family protein [Streptomyces chiangmaiensis]MED7820888.1 DUF5819 family protein [Streptomyces chiangmaiensis]